MSSPKSAPMPWAFVFGLVLLVLGVLFAANSDGGIGIGTVVLIVLGIVLIPTGLIQRSISQNRRP